MDIDKVRAQTALLEEYDSIKNAIARNKDAVEQKAFVYHIEAADHALSHRSIAFVFTPDESKEIYGVVSELLDARLKAVKEKLK